MTAFTIRGLCPLIKQHNFFFYMQMLPLTNEYRNISWGKGVGLKPCRIHVPIVLKSGSLNLLEPSRPVKACNGIALPLHAKV
jgi:hypothetical protein